MTKDVIGPIQALKEGCALLRRYPVLLLGFVLFVCLLLICALADVPHCLNWLLLALVALPVLLGGLHIMLVNAIRNRCPRITDLFSELRHFLKWIGATWTLIAASGIVFSACLLVLVIIANVLELWCTWPHGLSGELRRRAFILPAEILSPVIAFTLLMDYAFALFAATEMPTARQSVSRSRQLIKGRYFRILRTLMPLALIPGLLLGVGILVIKTDANAFGWPGWMLYAVAVIIAILVTLCGIASTYGYLRQPLPLTQAEH